MQSSFKYIFLNHIAKAKLILTLTVFFPLIVNIFWFVISLHFPEEIAVLQANPWQAVCLLLVENYKLLYPIFSMLICFKLCEADEEEKTATYCSKAIILIFCLLIAALLGLAFLLIGGKLCSVIYPWMHFQDYNVTSLIIPFFTKLFFYSLSIIAIQLLLCTYTKNVMVALGVPLALLVMGASMVYYPCSYAFPYSYSFQAALDFENGDGFLIDKIFCWNLWYSFIFFALRLGLFYIQLKKQNSHSTFR